MICVCGTVSRATGEFAAVGRGVTTGVIRGAGVALGTSNRPWRLDAVGETAGDETGDEVATAVAVGATDIARRGVIVAAGVVVAAAVAVATGVGAEVEVADVDVDADVAVVLVAASAFTNFFGGAFGGGAASDFIF